MRISLVFVGRRPVEWSSRERLWVSRALLLEGVGYPRWELVPLVVADVACGERREVDPIRVQCWDRDRRFLGLRVLRGSRG
jgi:hypothetical protein